MSTLGAHESICLKNGFCLEAETHFITDATFMVQSGHGWLQFPLDQVDRISPLPALPAAISASVIPVPASIPASPEELLIKAALHEGLEPDFVRSVAMIESGLDRNALSPKGAVGLMQLMPSTADWLKVDAGAADQNAQGGAAFLRQLLLRYKGNSALALAAYNAGPGAVDRYRGVPPYPETRRYVVKVLKEYARLQRLQSASSSLPFQARAAQPESVERTGWRQRTEAASVK